MQSNKTTKCFGLLQFILRESTQINCHIFSDFTYSLTPRRSVLLEELTGMQLVKKFPAFY
jgi:hypothetical protein